MDWHLKSTYEFEGELVRHDAFGDGPPVVLVHGTPWSSFNWRHLVPLLAARRRVFVFDLLGYGESQQGPDGQDVRLQRQARLLAALLAHWRLAGPAVVAHDFGGAVALRAHLLLGCDFERLVLIDPVALSPWGSPFFRHVQRHEAAFAGVPAAIHAAIVGAYVDGATAQTMPDDTRRGILQPWLSEAGQRAFYRQIAQAEAAYTDEIEPRYGDVARPVLIVWGREDRWLPPETGERLRRAIPAAQLRLIDGAGHLVQEDQPQVLAAAIESFLA